MDRASAPAIGTPALRPPASDVGPLGWLKRNLFNSPLNGALTIAAVAFLAWIVPPILEWVVFEAIWRKADPQTCRAAAGACWAFVHEKGRLIIFGRYPFAEHWRPLLAMVLLLAAVGISCNRNYWRSWLAAVWVVALAGVGLLMWGGVFGLSFVPTRNWGGLPLTLILAVVGMVASFPIAIALALGRRSKMPVIRALSVAYIELIRGVPLISLLFMASFMFPLFLPTGANVNELLRAQVAIIMFTAAYLAEVIRGGLQAIPKGQTEAAASLGLSYWQSTRMIVLPQALRVVIPPMVNTFISMFKDTSLVAIVGLTDLLLALRQAIADPSWRAFFLEGYVFIAVIYFAFCYFMSKYSQRLERDLSAGRRH